MSAPRITPAPVARHALYLDVAERLREQIFARILQPGDWIDEQSLAAAFGISRTPLREALKVLAVEGLVTMKPRRGAYVTEMSERDVTDVYHLLGLLESDAVAAAARDASAAQLASLRAMHAELEAAAGDRETFFRLNEAFHLQVLAVAGNRWRSQIVVDLRKVMKLNRHHSLFREGRIAESLAEHRALLEALERRDAPAAAALSLAHFRNGLVAAAPATRGAQPGGARRGARTVAGASSTPRTDARTARASGPGVREARSGAPERVRRNRSQALSRDRRARRLRASSRR